MSKMYAVMSTIAAALALLAYGVFLFADDFDYGVLAVWLLIIHAKYDILCEMGRRK